MIGSEFIETAGFLEVADSNDMVIIFPSTIARALIANPYGCFNWFGYLGDLGCHWSIFKLLSASKFPRLMALTKFKATQK